MLSVEWLDNLERKVLRGGSACVLADELQRASWDLTHPNEETRYRMIVSGGWKQQSDEGGAASYVWFHFPPELRGKKVRARLRLHAAPLLQTAYRALLHDEFGAGGGKARWGTLRQVKGPPWPEFHKFKYPELPPTLGETTTLAPRDKNSNVVEAPLPGPIQTDEKNPNIYLAIQSTALGSAVYWSNGVPDPGKAPTLIIDYEPADKDKR